MSIEGQNLQPESPKPEQREAHDNLSKGLFHDTAESGVARISDLTSPAKEAQMIAGVTMDSILTKVQMLKTAGYDTTLSELCKKFI